MKNEIQTGRNPDGYIIYIYMLGQTYCPERQLFKKKCKKKNYIYIYYRSWQTIDKCLSYCNDGMSMRSRPSGMCWRGVLVLRKLLPASQRNTLPFKPRRGNKNARPIAQETASKEQLHPSHPHWRKKNKQNKQKKKQVLLEGSGATHI